jgi:hypothetical protein
MRIRNDLHDTDFVINKVQPVHNFTMLLTVLRQVLREEDQIKVMKKLNRKFFEVELKTEDDSIHEFKEFLPEKTSDVGP